MNEKEINERLESIEKRLILIESKKKSFDENLPSEISVFEEQDNKIIVTHVNGETPKDKTQNITLLTLLGYKSKLNQNEILSNLIRDNVAMNMVPLDNFGTYINRLIPRYILRIGKAKSTNVKYKLTTFGEAFAKNLLKELNENANN